MAKRAYFTLSKHARRRIAQRGISIGQLRRVILHPDRKELDLDDPEITHAIKRFSRRGGSVVLRVLYNHDASPYRIVTAYFDRKLGRRK